MKRALIAAALAAVAMPAWAAGPGGIRTEPSVKTYQTLKCTITGSLKGRTLLAIKNTTGQTIPKNAVVELTYVFRNGVQPMFHRETLTAGKPAHIRPPGYDDFSWRPELHASYVTAVVARSCSARVKLSPYTR